MMSNDGSQLAVAGPTGLRDFFWTTRLRHRSNRLNGIAVPIAR
jgi:hypothetical protein